MQRLETERGKGRDDWPIREPQSNREGSLPEFNRACAINGIDTAISWTKRKYKSLGR